MNPVHRLEGEITVPGDKSISHRSVMLGALARGTTVVTHFLEGADCLSSIQCFRSLGVKIHNDPDKGLVRIEGRGLHGLQASGTNSGRGKQRHNHTADFRYIICPALYLNDHRRCVHPEASYGTDHHASVYDGG